MYKFLLLQSSLPHTFTLYHLCVEKKGSKKADKTHHTASTHISTWILQFFSTPHVCVCIFGAKELCVDVVVVCRILLRMLSSADLPPGSFLSFATLISTSLPQLCFLVSTPRLNIEIKFILLWVEKKHNREFRVVKLPVGIFMVFLNQNKKVVFFARLTVSLTQLNVGGVFCCTNK